MLGKLLGKKTSDSRFPAERITLAEGERDGLPAIAMINLAYREYAYRAEYPWHVQVQITLNDAYDSGFPTHSEAEVLNALEDRMEEELGTAGHVHFIARQSWNRIRFLDYYVGNGEAAERVLAAMAGTSPREFTTKVERDDSWANCAGFFGAL
jgi:hypothetical protein